MDDPEEFRLTLVQHLDELRNRIIKAVLLIAVGWIVGWVIFPNVYETLSGWARSQIPKSVDYREVFKSVTEPFILKFKLSFYLGLLMVFPFVVLQGWGFVKPGLKAAERKALARVIPFSVVLFFGGAALCWLILPVALHWFISYLGEFPGTGVYQEPGTLVFFIAKMLLAFGIGFQLPVIVFFLAKIGILTPEMLRQYWRHATVGIFTLAMLLTPSNDLPSMLTMAIPLTLLFFGSMMAVQWTNRGKRDPALDELD